MVFYFNCRLVAMWLLVFGVSSSWCHGFFLQCVVVLFPGHTHFWTFGSHPNYVSYVVKGVKKVGSAVHNKNPNH